MPRRRTSSLSTALLPGADHARWSPHRWSSMYIHFSYYRSSLTMSQILGRVPKRQVRQGRCRRAPRSRRREQGFCYANVPFLCRWKGCHSGGIPIHQGRTCRWCWSKITEGCHRCYLQAKGINDRLGRGPCVRGTNIEFMPFEMSRFIRRAYVKTQAAR